MRISKQILFRERYHLLPGDDQVIQDPDIHERERILQSPRDQFIRMARLGDTARMVV